MSLIVNGTEIENVIVIRRATGESVEIEKLQDQNGNIIFEKVSAVFRPNTGLVYMAYDSNGNAKYNVASGTSVSMAFCPWKTAQPVRSRRFMI